MNRMDFLIATHNMKKRDELARILAPLGVCVLTADEVGVTLTDVEETGKTFEENAFLKADSGCRESGLPCIADDSGLEVDALGARRACIPRATRASMGTIKKTTRFCWKTSRQFRHRGARRALSAACAAFSRMGGILRCTAPVRGRLHLNRTARAALDMIRCFSWGKKPLGS